MEISELEIVEKVHGFFKSRGLKLSVAESSTAGLISHMITALPGASAFFDSSVICYSRASKKALLGIKESLLKRHGEVSEETARAMAEALRDKSGTDFALATTGNLGPTALEGKRVGLVFIAVAFEGGAESKGMLFDGSRTEVKHSASWEALEFLYQVVSAWT